MLDFLFLRRVKSFNKSRYSRNRQTARVIFYFSLYINILIIFTVFSLFYNFVFKLGKYWFLYFLYLYTFLWNSLMRD